MTPLGKQCHKEVEIALITQTMEQVLKEIQEMKIDSKEFMQEIKLEIKDFILSADNKYTLKSEHNLNESRIKQIEEKTNKQEEKLNWINLKIAWFTAWISVIIFIIWHLWK